MLLALELYRDMVTHANKAQNNCLIMYVGI